MRNMEHNLMAHISRIQIPTSRKSQAAIVAIFRDIASDGVSAAILTVNGYRSDDIDAPRPANSRI